MSGKKEKRLGTEPTFVLGDPGSRAGHVPVAPRMHSGCPEKNAYATPDIALDRIISVAPSWSFVYSAKSAPNAMAGARHAKKRKATDDRHRPRLAGRKASVQSLT